MPNSARPTSRSPRTPELMAEATHPHRLLAIVTDTLEGSEPIDVIREDGGENGNGGETELRVVVPAVTGTANDPVAEVMTDVTAV